MLTHTTRHPMYTVFGPMWSCLERNITHLSWHYDVFFRNTRSYSSSFTKWYLTIDRVIRQLQRKIDIRKHYFHKITRLSVLTSTIAIVPPIPQITSNSVNCWNWYIHKVTWQAAAKLSIASCFSNCSSIHSHMARCHIYTNNTIYLSINITISAYLTGLWCSSTI